MLLKVENLVTTFQTQKGRFPAVSGISFEVDKGESLCIVGESGCGKSVTALSIMRLVQEPAGQIEQGQIYFKDHDLLKLPLSKMRKIRGKEISMIFQEPMTSLNPVFTVGNQIEEAILLHQQVTKAQARKRCLDIMELVGIPDVKNRIDFYPHQMSGGLRQRVMIAMALACEPSLLIADEPTTALDVTIQAQILELIRDLQKKMDMGLVLITHDFGVVAEMANKVAVMYAGKIVEQNTVKNIFDSPQHPYTRALQKAIPDARRRHLPLYSIPFMVPSLEELGDEQELTRRWERLESDLKEKTSSYSRQTEESARPNSDAENLVEVQELKVHYPIFGGLFGGQVDTVRAVDGVSLDIKKGEIVGLVGESGCGKSTLGKAVIRLVDSTTGSIQFRGKELTNLEGEALRSIRKNIQMIFQDPYSSLNPRMKVGSILEEPLIIHSICSRKERKPKALQLLDKVGLRAEAYDKYPHEFSGGQRQRIGIARALAVNPDFIIADEPVSALDVSIQAQILNLLKDLKREFNLTYLFISHDLNVVQYLCDSIIVMYNGKIVEKLTPDQIDDPSYEKQDYTKTLLAAIPRRYPGDKKDTVASEAREHA